MNPQPKLKPARSKKYLAFIRSLPCLICGSQADPHHHQPRGSGTMAGKIGDDYALPLCFKHHREVHDKGRSMWDEVWNKDPAYCIYELKKRWTEAGNKAFWNS